MLTQERLQEVLEYNPDTGEFTWIAQRGSRSDLVGERAGYPHWKGYWTIYVDGQSYWGHRVAWLYVHGKFPKGQIDHINRVRDDNRIANLRLATNGQNGANSKAKPSQYSPLKGVHWNKRWGGSWSSSIYHAGKRVWLGVFPTAEEAHAAYCEAAKKIHGEFFHSGQTT